MAPVEPDVKPSISDTPPPQGSATRAGKPSLVERFKALVTEYGPVALVLLFLLQGLVVVGFYLAFQLGFQAESTGAKAGTWGAAYLASQAVKPLRFAAVLVLTPVVARIPPVARFIERNKHKWRM